MYLSSDVSKFLNSIYSSYHFKAPYSKELKERIVSIVETEIEALNRNLIGLSFIKELDKYFVFKDGNLFQIKEIYFLDNKELLINSLNPIWFSKKDIKKSKNKNLMKIKLYLCLLKEDNHNLSNLFNLKEPLILNETYSSLCSLENPFFIAKKQKEKTLFKKIENIEFDEKEWELFKKDFIEFAYKYINYSNLHKRLRKLLINTYLKTKELQNLGLDRYIVNNVFVLPTEELLKYDFKENNAFEILKQHAKYHYEGIEKVRNFL